MRRLAVLLPALTLAAHPTFEHGLHLEPLAPPTAHHGENMRLSRFLVALPGIDQTPPRLVGRCVDGAEVAAKLPLELGVVELRMDRLAFAGQELGAAESGLPSPAAREALDVALAQAAEATRWLSRRGCQPWGPRDTPWLLIAADQRVPVQALEGVMESAHLQGFRDLAVLVDDGSPAPELPPEPLPKRPVELVLVDQDGLWTAIGDEERRSGSLEDVQVWLRTGELKADRVTVVLPPTRTLQDLVHVQDALLGAGVLAVHPGHADALGTVTPAEPPSTVKGALNWVVDADGVVPVHLVRLPERGMAVPPMRLGPELLFEELELVGPRQPLPVEAQLRTRDEVLLACYATARQEQPSLAGELLIEFQIERDGAVADLKVVDQGLGSEVGPCVRQGLAAMRFAPAEGATLVSVRARFTP